MTDYKQWCATMFTAIDSKDSDAFVTFLTADAQFRFGSAPAVTGTATIVDALEAFFGSIASLTHRIFDIWDVEDHLICRGEVDYTRLDGNTVTAPFCDVFTLRDGEISHYDIYLDPTPLSAP